MAARYFSAEEVLQQIFAEEEKSDIDDSSEEDLSSANEEDSESNSDNNSDGNEDMIDVESNEIGKIVCPFFCLHFDKWSISCKCIQIYI